MNKFWYYFSIIYLCIGLLWSIFLTFIIIVISNRINKIDPNLINANIGAFRKLKVLQQFRAADMIANILLCPYCFACILVKSVISKIK